MIPLLRLIKIYFRWRTEARLWKPPSKCWILIGMDLLQRKNLSRYTSPHFRWIMARNSCMNYGGKISSSILLIYYISSFLFQASKTLDKKQIEMVFERFDLNKDGRLSKDEFQKLMTKYSNWNVCCILSILYSLYLKNTNTT